MKKKGTPLAKKIAIQAVRRGYDGFFKVDEVSFQHSLHQGGESAVIQREVFGRGQASVVLLYDVNNKMVALIEQCRAGALSPFMANPQKQVVGEEANQAWLLEPVAGMIEPGESAESAAHREMLEEAGVQTAELEFVCQFYPSPGACTEVLHLFAAEVDVPSLPDYSGLADEVEDIRLVKLSFAEAKQKLLSAEFNVASTIIGLQWLFFQKCVH